MILAIDTATRWTGIALHDGTSVVAEYGWKCQNTQTIELAPAVQDLLTRTSTAIADIDAIAVAIGPGSYTGLRIGLGFAKGIALTNGTKLIGIPTHDILATSIGKQRGNLWSIIEAGRRRITAQPYEWHRTKGWIQSGDPQNLTWDEMIVEAGNGDNFAGEIHDDARKQIRAAGKKLRTLAPAYSTRRAGFLAELAWQRLKKDDTDNPAELVPTYMRDPAENVKG